MSAGSPAAVGALCRLISHDLLQGSLLDSNLAHARDALLSSISEAQAGRESQQLEQLDHHHAGYGSQASAGQQEPGGDAEPTEQEVLMRTLALLILSGNGRRPGQQHSQSRKQLPLPWEHDGGGGVAA
jgi:hypothetical protein